MGQAGCFSSVSAIASAIAAGGDHADLDGGHFDIVENGVDLFGDESRFQCPERPDTLRVLRHDSRNGCHAIGTECRKRFQVGGYAGAAARVGSGDSQDVGDHRVFRCVLSDSFP